MNRINSEKVNVNNIELHYIKLVFNLANINYLFI